MQKFMIKNSYSVEATYEKQNLHSMVNQYTTKLTFNDKQEKAQSMVNNIQQQKVQGLLVIYAGLLFVFRLLLN